MATIAFDITDPENDIGLQGPVACGQLWEEWFTTYLNGALKQKYWSSSSTHVFAFATDIKLYVSNDRPFISNFVSIKLNFASCYIV